MEKDEAKESLKTIVLSDLFFYVLGMIKSTKTLMDEKTFKEEVTEHGENFIKHLTKLINYEKHE